MPEHNYSPSEVTVGPVLEPITVADVKDAAFIIDDSSYDLYISKQLIPSARRHVEELAVRSLITQTRAQYYDELRDIMWLTYGPVSAVTSVTYKDSDEASQTLTASLYDLDNKREPARLVRGYNENYPTSIRDTNSVVVTMTCGYGLTYTSVPIIYRRACIMWAALELHNRVPIACADDYMKSLRALETLISIEGRTRQYA